MNRIHSIARSSTYLCIILPLVTIANPAWLIKNPLIPITIYYQGIFTSQVQCAKYIGPLELPTTTGEVARCKKNITVMLHPFIGVELDEVYPASTNKKTPWYQCLNPLHWLTKKLERKAYLDNKYLTISVENPTPEKKLAKTLIKHSNALSLLNFGQERDIANHKKRVDACQEQFPENPKFFFGGSRGAATTFNALAYWGAEYKNVAGVVLEGCYDTLFNTISDRVHPMVKKLGLHKKLHSLIGKITEYDPFGISPLKSVENFPADIPVIFVTSRADTVVPPERTRNLARTLAARGKNDVYLIELSYSSHRGYTVDNEQDRQLYQNALHAIYKKLDLPYIPEYAQEYQDTVDQFLVKV